MKSILLASVATVALAGAAAAEITWSGTGSVTVGRTGSVDAVAASVTDAQLQAYASDTTLLAANDIFSATERTAYNALTTTEAKLAYINAWWGDLTAAEKAAAVAKLVAGQASGGTGALAVSGTTTDSAAIAGIDNLWTAGDEALYIAARAAVDDALGAIAGWKDNTAVISTVDAPAVNTAINDIEAAASAGIAGWTATASADVVGGTTTYAAAYKNAKAASTALDEQRRLRKLNKGAAAAAAGDTKMTATGTLTAAMTIGDGYVASLSFNAGTGAFGALSLATPDMGTLTFSPNAIAATVDASDKGGDLKYTNTVGGWAVAVTLDVDADSDEAGSAGDARNGVAAVASDSQWSVSASGTLSEGTTASLAFDEEGGYSMGVATSLAGLDLSLGTSSTAAAGTVNTMGIGYTMGEVSIGVDYSDEYADNTYTLSLGYAMDGTAFSLAYQENADYDLSVSTSVAGFAVKLATDEDAAWSLSASTPIGNAGTLSASMNSADAMSLTAAFKF